MQTFREIYHFDRKKIEETLREKAALELWRPDEEVIQINEMVVRFDTEPGDGIDELVAAKIFVEIPSNE